LENGEKQRQVREREDKGDKQKKEIERERRKTEIIKTGKEIIRKDK
jgi:hypothetical protein